MSVFKNGKFYHYEFFLDGRRHRGSTGTANKAQAIQEERRQRERLEKSYSQVSVAAKKGTKMAAKWCPRSGAVLRAPFPLVGRCCSERPGAVKGAPLLGAAKRTLDGEDRSERIAEEGKARRNIGEGWAAILVPSPAASNSQVIEEEAREQRRKTIQQAADEFLVEYTAKHESPTFAAYALGHITDHLGKKLVVEITPTVVKGFQTARLAEKAGPKSINNEVLLLLRLCGDQGDLIRGRLRREKAMKLATPPSPGKAYTADEKARMLAEAAKLRSKNMYPALVLDLNCGLRDKELRGLRWQQIDLIHKKQLTVGKSKTEAGTGRVIPLNDTVMIALEAHAAWYIRRFGECKPEWFVFPAGKGQPNDPTKPVTTLRTAWTKVRDQAKVVGRWHDNRHTLVTELAESGAGDEVIMSIAGHVSRAMLSRYSHVRMEAKRRALDEIAARQRTADEKRNEASQKLLTEAQPHAGTPRVQ